MSATAEQTTATVDAAVTLAQAVDLPTQRELRRLDASLRQLRYLRYCYWMTADRDVADRRAIRRAAARLRGRVIYVFGADLLPLNTPR